MKKVLLLAIAIAAITMVGCSKGEIKTSSTGMTLTASVGEPQASKATIGDNWQFSFVKDDKVWVTNTVHMWAGSDPYGNIHCYDFVKGDAAFTSSGAKTTDVAATWYAFFPNREVSLSGQTGARDYAANHFVYKGSQKDVPAHTKSLNITMYPQMSIIKIVNNKGDINIKAKASNGEYLWRMEFKNQTAAFDVITSSVVYSLLEASKIGTYYIAVPSQYAFDLYDGTTLLKSIAADKLVAGKYYTLVITGSTTKSEALTGIFTINGSGDKVKFSRGNLWYDNSTWLFETNQYDVYDYAYEKYHVSNFFYETDGNYGSEATYTGDKTTVDWGVPYCNAHSLAAGTWRTLSMDEWTYLMQTRTNADQKVGFATVAGMKGLIILPDSFTDPMKNKGTGAFVPKSTTEYSANEYTSENWVNMEEAGAVFLPAANHRYSNRPIGSDGYYWSTTTEPVYNVARCLEFHSNNITLTTNDNRSNGRSVRLVTGVTK